MAITQGRIALVGDAAHCIGENTKVIEADGQYIAPGFMDAHIHVESAMLTCGEYARAVVPHGTTGIFMDPHEICNVCGPEGVKYMIEDAKNAPLKCMANAPSCVPAVAGFEDTGSAIGPNEIREMMTWDGIVGLGEMMSFPNVLSGEENIHGELAGYRPGAERVYRIRRAVLPRVYQSSRCAGKNASRHVCADALRQCLA